MSEPEERSHHQVAELLAAYLDNRVTADERQLVEGHLARCQACQQHLLALRQTVRLVRQLPPVVPPRTFVLRATDVAHRPTFRWMRRRLSGGLGWTPAVGIILLRAGTQPANLAMRPTAPTIVSSASPPLPTPSPALVQAQGLSESVSAPAPVTSAPTGMPTRPAAGPTLETRRGQLPRTATPAFDRAEQAAPAPLAGELPSAAPAEAPALCEEDRSCQLTAALASPTPAFVLPMAPAPERPATATPAATGLAGATVPQVAATPASTVSVIPSALATPPVEQLPEGESHEALRAAGAAPGGMLPMAPSRREPVLITVTSPTLVIGSGVITVSGWLPLPEGVWLQAEIWRDGQPLEWAIPESQLTRLDAAGRFSLRLQARLDQAALDLSKAPPGDYEIRIRALDEWLSVEARLPLPDVSHDHAP